MFFQKESFYFYVRQSFSQVLKSINRLNHCVIDILVVSFQFNSTFFLLVWMR